MTHNTWSLRHDPAATNARHLWMALGLGGKIIKQPRGISACCPAHEERNPSFSLRVAADGTLAGKCFVCDFSCDAIGLVQKVRGCGFKEAAEELAAICGRWGDFIPESIVAPSTPLRVVPKIDADRYDSIVDALLKRCPLREQRDVADYVRGRGIYADAEAHGLGALPRDTHQLVRDLSAEFGEKDVEAAGLAKAGKVPFGAHRLLIPWRGRDGKVCSLQRRRIDNEHPRYVSPPSLGPTQPFGAEHYEAALAFHRLGGREPVVAWTEGALDALALTALNRRGDNVPMIVLAIPSATTVRPEWSVFNDGMHVEVYTDADAAGEKAAAALVAISKGARSVRRFVPEVGKDAGDVLAHRGAV